MTHRTVWEAFYGLYSRPFSLTPDLRFAYQSQSHTHAVDEVTDALKRREGVVAVTGEVGTGKTMLCRTLLAGIEKRSFQSVILDPLLSAEELMLQVLTDFGLIASTDPAHNEPMTDVTRHRLVATLHQFLASLIPLNAHAVLLIDEAQHLSPPVLEQVRLLANFETERAKLLQIVLVGQPDLDELLDRPEMRPLNQRIARRVQLHPLNEREVRDYVETRIAVASERPADAEDDERSSPVAFSNGAIAAIASITQGVPRVINTLCDRALESAFERQAPVIDRRAVISGARHLRLPIPPGQRVSKAALAAAAVIVVAAGAAGAWWWTNRTVATTPTPSAAQPGALATPPQVAATPPEPVPLPAAPPDGVAPGSSTAAAPPPTVATPAPAQPAAASAESATANTTGTTSDAPARPAGSAVASPALASARAFEIAVAAFRTAQRADEVADDISDSGLPVSTRQDSGWYRVIVGPYPTLAEAEAARTSLTQQGFTGIRVSPSTPAP